LDVFAIVEESVQDVCVLIDVSTAGGLNIVNISVIDFKAVDEVVETEFDITASIESEPFWGND
jgi:multisubunit Na+/H+ antiporter MnhB subunit